MTPDITEIQDFRDVIQIMVNGERPLIVGGHSVNVWATYYHSRLSKQLAEFFPFTTKDLDLYGSVKLLEVLHKKFGGSIPKIEPRAPVAGSMQVILDGKERRIEILRTVKGLDTKDLEDSMNISVCGNVGPRARAAEGTQGKNM